MTLLKKTLAAIGTAAALASAPASAIQLLIFDGADNLLFAATSTVLPAPPNPNANKVSIDGTINGWAVSLVGSQATYGDPYSLTISGNFYRYDGSGAANNTSDMLVSRGIIDYAGPDYSCDAGGKYTSPGFSVSNCAPASTSYAGTGFLSKSSGYTLENATSSATDASTLKFRVADYAFGTRFPAGKLVGLEDRLFISSKPSSGSSTSMQVDFTNGSATNIGTNAYDGSAGLDRVETKYFTQTNGTLIAGFDLTAPAGGTQGTSNGFNLSNTITSVPEPGTLALLGLSLVGLGFLRRKQAA